MTRRHLDLLIGDLKREKVFWGALLFILVLHLLTYPSIHTIGDEQRYLNVSRNICNLDFSDFIETGNNITDRNVGRVHGPLVHTIVCITSPLHNFGVESAGIVSFMFLVGGVVGWYYSTGFLPETTRRRLVLLLSANSLLWAYSFRALIDVPFGVLLSLGLMQAYLYFEFRKNRNYYLSLIFLSLAFFTKEFAAIMIPIVFFYLLLKKEKSIKAWGLAVLPVIPYAIYESVLGFKDFWMYLIAFKATSALDVTYHTEVPYGGLPVIVTMAGVFGPGIISCILSWKDIAKADKIKNFLIFALAVWLVWELTFDLVAVINIPRYHTTLIPFFSLIIAVAAEKDKNLKYIYYMALLFTLATGFVIAFYFHTYSEAIWKVIPIGGISG